MRHLYRLYHWWKELPGKDRTIIILDIIGIAIVAAYTWQARKANWLTQQTLAVAQRSHLGINNVQVTSYKPDEFRVTFDIENRGNSASTGVRLDLRIADLNATKPCIIISVPKSISYGDFPFQTGTLYHSSVDFEDFTNKQWVDVTVHRSFLKITGVLDYNDGFGVVRETGICFRYDGNWEVCPATNDNANLQNCK
jgi:hypothetical protein